MAAKNALAEIRQDLESHIGEIVWIKANRGRRKTIIREGILENTYPYHFLVKLDAQKHPVRVISVSYADVLTQTVELSIGKPDRRMVPTTN
ncbi:MAG: Veg protein [Firmicutes bacterium]|nr:Veg protein [Bacillota bacterium]